MAAATIVAAVLLLGSPTVARAEEGREALEPSPVCDGLSTISLIAHADYAVQGAASAPSADCDYSLEVSQLPVTDRPDGAEPCVVTATPRQIGTTGAGVRLDTTGDCNEVEISWTINVSGPSFAAGAMQQSSGYAAAYAKIWGEDPFGLDVFYNKSKITWAYTSTTVSSGSHYPTDWVLWSGWSVKSRVSSFVPQGNTRYDGYNNVKFKAFQFTEANTKATLYAKPGGAFTCSFSIKWKWKPIGFDDDSLCDAE